jgi:hypothetical protein
VCGDGLFVAPGLLQIKITTVSSCYLLLKAVLARAQAGAGGWAWTSPQVDVCQSTCSCWCSPCLQADLFEQPKGAATAMLSSHTGVSIRTLTERSSARTSIKCRRV